ncbi:GNAT family N-acetyltransferase [Pedobacter mendelii]|uniref:N-acetyltransferase domain-containing protein n=1 Tax=Pedobacter mendelii TaxID=1908240 RepID=A0ABQ2BKE7_9SPHI|nr:GNAT family N-acetyltransferase [Pedobacter mendelii]GGI28357.1 hypothetical protein GCM10008119_32250 [Pedobacter mendelii]
MEEELRLEASANIISTELKEALEQSILPKVFNLNKNYLFNTLWTLISKIENKIIGDLCFTGEPEANGEIKIGYGTYEGFKGKGYLTEAVGRIVKWAIDQPEVKTISVSIAIGNLASYSILDKNTFVKVAKGEGMFNWKLKVRRST